MQLRTPQPKQYIRETHLQDAPYICGSLSDMVSGFIDTASFHIMNRADIEHILGGQLDYNSQDQFLLDLERCKDWSWPACEANIEASLSTGKKQTPAKIGIKSRNSCTTF